MRKLQKYSQKSDLMNIRVKIGKEVFRFNLYEELKVDENIINDEINDQPLIRGFLGTLLTKLERIRADKKAELEKIYSELYVSYKSSVNKDIGKYPSDDMAKQLVLKTARYQEAQSEFIISDENLNKIENCVESFDQRSYLIQTLSANLRKSS